MFIKTTARGRLSWEGLLCGLIWSLAILLPNAAAAASVNLEWDPNAEPDLAGYKVHYGTTSGTYTEIVDVGNTTIVTVDDMVTGNPYYFAVTAYNTEGLESLPSNEIIVSSLNNAPAISTIASQSIGEDSVTGALAFTVGDAETTPGSLTVSGTSSNPALVPTAGIVFGGSGSSRTVTVTPAPDQSGTATVTLSVSDGTMTASSTFLLTVNAVNDAPTIGTIAGQTIGEDTATGALVFTVGDAETAAASLTLSGTSSNPALVPTAGIVFGGSGPSRTATVTPAPNQSGTATVTLSVSDGTMTAASTFLLTVNAVNDAPTIGTIAGQTIGEDTATGALAFTVGDAETAVASLTLSGTSSNPALVPTAGIVFGGSGTSRTVSVTPASNQSGTATVTLSVSDGTMTAASTFLLTVSAVNDAPTIGTIAGQTINENSATGALAFTVGDAETAAASLTLSGTSSNPALVPTAGIVFGGSGTSRTVTVTPASNQSGTATVTLSVSDGTMTAASTFLLTVNASEIPGVLEIVTLSGDEAPGAGGARFSAFSSDVRSDGDGDSAFLGTLNTASGSAKGIWAETDGLLNLVARQGSAAPGVPGALFDAFTTSPRWTGSGHLLLYSKLLAGPGGVTTSNDYGLWHQSPSGPLQLVVRENDQAAGLAVGAAFLQLGSNPVLGADGHFAFTATLKTSSPLGITSADDSGLWTNFSGPLALLVREGAAAPGIANGAKLDTFTTALISANSSGQIAFRTVLKSTTGVTTANKYGIWMWDGTQLAKIVRGGERAPGTPTGAVFNLPAAPLLRDAMLLFYSTLAATGGVTKSNDTGIWILENGTVSIVAREGSAAPGAPSGALFNSLPVTLAGNDQGDFIFKAVLRTGGAITSSNSDGIWARSPATLNGLTLIVREGAQAPQTPAGAVFSIFDTAIVSGGGREAFTANLLAGKGGVTTANDRGLWMRSAAGQFVLVLREGATVPISATEIRTVANITLDKSSEAGAAGFSDANSIKLLVTFTNGSSAIMSYAAP